MAEFDQLTASEALEVSISAAQMEPKLAAAVAAARQLAKRVDTLDQMGWVIDGKLDNVTMPIYLRYLDQLGLTVPTAKVAAPAKPVAPEVAREPSGIAKLQAVVGGRAG